LAYALDYFFLIMSLFSYMAELALSMALTLPQSGTKLSLKLDSWKVHYRHLQTLMPSLMRKCFGHHSLSKNSGDVVHAIFALLLGHAPLHWPLLLHGTLIYECITALMNARLAFTPSALQKARVARDRLLS